MHFVLKSSLIMRYDHHIFICTNQKTEGKKCCGEERGMELVKEFKRQLTAKGVQSNVRVQRSGCLDECSFGPSMVIYPQGTHYGHVQLEDVSRIIDEHLLNNKTLEDLELKF